MTSRSWRNRYAAVISIAAFLCLGMFVSNAALSGPARGPNAADRVQSPEPQASRKPKRQRTANSNSNGTSATANGNRNGSGQESQGPKPRPDEHVVIISVDGMKRDYYTRASELGIKVPTLTSMKLNGSYAEGVEGVYPTVTYPSHTAIVTGARPAVSGIVENTIFEPPTEPQTGDWYWYSKALTAETLWMAAKIAGLTVGSVGWPVTVGADIDYNVPEIWDPSEHPPTGKRTVENSTPGLIDKITAAGPPGTADEFRTNATAFIIKNYKPNLVLLHLYELD
ncbi:MAG TPA: ectonucleotide pyrophosphatase/phosphodiesterase, partial [Blastocatellia bacterium]|nr:ectonucleotide pyrophosphatase/phosphodiesterase [Blastocatellia bacterium]